MANNTALTVGLDGKRAVENNTGLGNYSRYALNILSLTFPSTRFRLYAPRQKENPRLAPLLDRPNIETSFAATSWGAPGRAFWRSIDLPLDLRRDNVDVYHGLSNEIPLTIKGVCASVVTIHDTIYRRCPADYRPIDRRLYDFKYGRSARIADRVIAISERTKADIVEFYDIDPAKIDVIYQGYDPVFSLDIPTQKKFEVRAKYKLPQNYILTVGTVQPRKNQMLALKALSQLPESVKLVVVGRLWGDYGKDFANYISRNNLSNRVLLLDNVDFNDLPAIYADAAVSIYPSRYEGFGLPVVESLAAGTPVIAATGSCLEEAGGPGAVYIHPDDVSALADAAAHIMDDNVFREKLVRKGKSHIKKFSADNFAKATMAAYRKALII